MMFSRSSIITSRFTSARNGKLNSLFVRRRLLPLVQAASVLSVSGWTRDRIASKRLGLPVSILNNQSSREHIEHGSLLFSDDNESPSMAWTFFFPKGDNNEEILVRGSFDIWIARDIWIGCKPALAYRTFILKILKQRGLVDEYEKLWRIWLSRNYPRGLEERTREDIQVSDRSAIERAYNEEREEIRGRFREGQSLVEVALRFNDHPIWYLPRAEKAVGVDEFAALMAQKKTRDLSPLEIQWLRSQRRRGFQLDEVARLLQRTRSDLEERLREQKDEIFGSGLVCGPQEVPAEIQERVFCTRLLSILNGLSESTMTRDWREALSNKPDWYWLSCIANSISAEMRDILGSLQAPTFERLGRLPPAETTEAGVYARLATSRFNLQTPTDRYLYVGSASTHTGGLRRRVSEHLTQKSRLDQDILDYNLDGPGKFVRLMSIEHQSSNDKDIMDVRYIVTLAEAILAVWLGALQSPLSKSPITQLQKDLCPWDLETLDYTPWSLRNPLVQPVYKPKSLRSSPKPLKLNIADTFVDNLYWEKLGSKPLAQDNIMVY